MDINEEFQEFVYRVQTMPRDELIAYISILLGLILVIIAIIMLLQ